jgi:hypothetical protein
MADPRGYRHGVRLIVIAVVSAALSYLLSAWIWRWCVARKVAPPRRAAGCRAGRMSNGLSRSGLAGLVDTLAVAAAVLASIAMIQLVTGSLPVTLAYAGGLVVLGLIAFAAARRRRRARRRPRRRCPTGRSPSRRSSSPGWRSPITDRANRLVCANAAYELWFGSSHAPPRLPVDGASSEHLARAARAAWREA